MASCGAGIDHCRSGRECASRGPAFFQGIEQPPGDTCGALARSSAPPPRLCVCGSQRRASGSTRRHRHSRSAPAWHTPALSPAAHRCLPLTGIRILDLSRVWAGPHGTRYLADFGAEVIKVESRKFPDGRGSNDAAFAEINRNKRSITLNFQMPEGRELLKRLVAISDVVVENFSPRVMVQYALDYQHLRGVRPDPIMVSMPFGQSGPHSLVSYGGPLMAYTGMALLWGCRFSARCPQQDCLSGLYRRRDVCTRCDRCPAPSRQHRQGQYIEIAQVETTTAAMEVAFFDYFTTGTIAAPAAIATPTVSRRAGLPAWGMMPGCHKLPHGRALACPRPAHW